MSYFVKGVIQRRNLVILLLTQLCTVLLPDTNEDDELRFADKKIFMMCYIGLLSVCLKIVCICSSQYFPGKTIARQYEIRRRELEQVNM